MQVTAQCCRAHRGDGSVRVDVGGRRPCAAGRTGSIPHAATRDDGLHVKGVVCESSSRQRGDACVVVELGRRTPDASGVTDAMGNPLAPDEREDMEGAIRQGGGRGGDHIRTGLELRGTALSTTTRQHAVRDWAVHRVADGRVGRVQGADTVELCTSARANHVRPQEPDRVSAPRVHNCAAPWRLNAQAPSRRSCGGRTAWARRQPVGVAARGQEDCLPAAGHMQRGTRSGCPGRCGSSGSGALLQFLIQGPPPRSTPATSHPSASASGGWVQIGATSCPLAQTSRSWTRSRPRSPSRATPPGSWCWTIFPTTNGCRASRTSWHQAETAFLVQDDEPSTFRLRWFTPVAEVALCGHATLASAHWLWESGTLPEGSVAAFETLSGRLTAEPDRHHIVLDLPAVPAAQVPASADLLTALRGTAPVWTGVTGNDDPGERNMIAGATKSPRAAYDDSHPTWRPSRDSRSAGSSSQPGVAPAERSRATSPLHSGYPRTRSQDRPLHYRPLLQRDGFAPPCSPNRRPHAEEH